MISLLASIPNLFFYFLCFFLTDATWTARYREWRGSIAPPFYLQEVRNGPWTLVSSWWKTQQWQNTASRSKMLMSTMRGPMSAPYSQTRNQNRQKSISSSKVKRRYLCQHPKHNHILLPSVSNGIKQDQCCVLVCSEPRFSNVSVHFTPVAM